MERNASSRTNQRSVTGIGSPNNYSCVSKRKAVLCREFATLGAGCRNRESQTGVRNSCTDRLELVPMAEPVVSRNQSLRSASLCQRDPDTDHCGQDHGSYSMMADSVARMAIRPTGGESIWAGRTKSDLIVSQSRNQHPRNTRYATHIAAAEPKETSTQGILPLQPVYSQLVTTRCPKSQVVRTRVCSRNAMQDNIGERPRQEASEASLHRGPSGSKSCPNLRTLGVHLVDGHTTEPFIGFVQRADDLDWNGHKTVQILDPNKARSTLRKVPMDYGHCRQHRCRQSSVDAEGSCSIYPLNERRYTQGKTAGAYETIDSTDRLSVLDGGELVRAVVQGVATESTPLRRSSTVVPRPAKPTRRHKVSDSYRQTAVFYQEPSGDKGFVRWVVCIVFGLSLAAFLYVYLSYHLRYQFIVALVISSVASPLVAVTCLVSKRVRCCGVLAAPSVFTTQTGRIGFLLLLTGVLLCGPLTNICLSMREISRSFSCGIDQSHNQTLLMTNPYKGLVGQLNLTMVGLQEAVVRAEDDLKPLEEKLRLLNHGIHNGLLQLFGSQKAWDWYYVPKDEQWRSSANYLKRSAITYTESACYCLYMQGYCNMACKVFVDRAYGACVNSISKAKIQCLGVLEALANVYKHAQGVLDSLNPDRWAPKSTNLTPNKRQILLMGTRGQEQRWNEVLSDDSDICEPLHSIVVCQGLNNSDLLCRPSGWAGNVIHVAVNSTLTALGQLEGYLHTSVRYGPPPPPPTHHPAAAIPVAAAGETANETRVRQRFLEGFDNAVDRVEQALLLVARVIPVIGCFLVGWAASSYLTLYLCVDPTYLPTTTWLTDEGGREWRFSTAEEEHPQPRVVEEPPGSFCFERLASGHHSMSPTDGLFVVILHATVTGVCGFLDFSLSWVLGLIRRHSRPPFDVTGANSLSSVVRGNGTLAKILKEFLRGFHAGHWFGFFDDGFACMPASSSSSLVSLAILVALYGVLIVGVMLKRRLLLLRGAICGQFYPERELARSQCLSGVIRAKRTRVLRSIKAAAAAAAAAAASSSSPAGTEQKTATCEGDLLRQLMDLQPDHASGSICHRLLFQRVSLCIICRSSAATHACPCSVCQRQDPAARVRCCDECLRAVEGNVRSPSLCRESSSNGYVDLI